MQLLPLVIMVSLALTGLLFIMVTLQREDDRIATEGFFKRKWKGHYDF